MKQVTVYECEHCSQLFRTPNRHDCKKNSSKKNCFTCKFLRGWIEHKYNEEYGYEPNEPDCQALPDELDWHDYDIEQIKRMNYDMQCEHWEEGEYDYSKDYLENDIKNIF